MFFCVPYWGRQYELKPIFVNNYIETILLNVTPDRFVNIAQVIYKLKIPTIVAPVPSDKIFIIIFAQRMSFTFLIED